MLLAVHYQDMEHLGSLESTQEDRVALCYRLVQLLRPIYTVLLFSILQAYDRPRTLLSTI